jgi:hypothetical protein
LYDFFYFSANAVSIARSNGVCKKFAFGAKDYFIALDIYWGDLLNVRFESERTNRFFYFGQKGLFPQNFVIFFFHTISSLIVAFK